MGLMSQKLRNSAKMEECTFQTPHCVGGTETTVLCHAPSATKGMGNKSPDYWAAFGCHACHSALDNHKMSGVEEQFYWLRGIHRTWERWLERGLIVICGIDMDKPKTRPKRKANLPSRPLQSRNDLRRKSPAPTSPNTE